MQARNCFRLSHITYEQFKIPSVVLFQHHIPLFISYFTLCLQWEQVSTFVTRNQISRGCVHGLQQLGAGFHLLSSQLAAIKTLRAELCHIFSKLRSRFHNVSGFLIWPVRAGSAEVRPLCCTLGMSRHKAQFRLFCFWMWVCGVERSQEAIYSLGAVITAECSSHARIFVSSDLEEAN